MANKLPSIMFILVALVLISNAPLGHALLSGLLINATISGQLSCTPTGNPAPGASFVPGVVVNATCLGSNNTPLSGSATTNVAGGFNISITTPNIFPISLLGGGSLSNCTVSIKLPVNASSNCTALPLQGLLTSVPQFDGVVVASPPSSRVVLRLMARVFIPSS